MLENLKSKFKNPFDKRTGFFAPKAVKKSLKKQRKAFAEFKAKNPNAVMLCLRDPDFNGTMTVKSRKSRMPLTWSEEKALKDLPPGRVKKIFVKGLENKYYGEAV